MTFSKRRTLVGLALVGMVGGVASSACNFETLTTAETDVVLTIQDEGRDYSELRTYVLPDEVIDLCEAAESKPPGEGGAGGSSGSSDLDFDVDLEECFEVNHEFDDLVLEKLAEHMDALGYRRIEDPTEEEPDVVLLPGYVARDNFYTGSFYWCDPYYYYGGCWYPSYPYVYNLPTGALLVDMIVVDESQDGEFSSAWVMAAQGLFSSSSEVDAGERIERAIDQAFAQSDYLAEGGEL